MEIISRNCFAQQNDVKNLRGIVAGSDDQSQTKSCDCKIYFIANPEDMLKASRIYASLNGVFAIFKQPNVPLEFLTGHIQKNLIKRKDESRF